MTSMLFVYIFLLATLIHNGYQRSQGRTCARLRIKNAIVDDEGKALLPGTVVNITCHHGYHLAGGNQSVCLEDLNWSVVHHRGCLTLKEYKDYCRSMWTEFKMTDGGEAMCAGNMTFGAVIPCHGPHIEETSQPIILGVIISVGVFIVIVFIISVLYIRKPRSYRSRGLRATVRFQNTDHAIDLVLPSYEDTIKNTPTTPPPTFEESEATLARNENQVGEDGVDETTSSNDRTTNYDPPPYEE